MKISHAWLKEIVPGTGSAKDVAALLTSRGIEVEHIEEQGSGWDGVIAAQIREMGPHPQADRLTLCKVDTGAGITEIVCGAKNMKPGDKVALAQPGTVLPGNFKIEVSKIRGVVSNGMLCSESELGLLGSKAVSEGILILSQEVKLGTPLKKALGRNDTILQLKPTPNRGDCLSHLGVAREVSAALGLKLVQPKIAKWTPKGSPIPVHVACDDAYQFAGLVIDGVKVGPSPDALAQRLEALGSRSISNLVDISNLVMFELGHPVHFYDADKLSGSLQARNAKSGEKLKLLDGREISLQTADVVIADKNSVLGLAGVMGGQTSEVSSSTRRILIECAEFSPSAVRKSALKHAARTEASTRFEKGIDPEGIARVVGRAAQLVLEHAGGKIVGGSFDHSQKLKPTSPIKTSAEWILAAIAEKPLWPDAKVKQTLERLGCKVTGSSKSWTVKPPSYRRDLKLPEDLVDEVGRSLGYDQVPATFPAIRTAPKASLERMADQVAKSSLVRAGLFEHIAYAFTSKNDLTRFSSDWLTNTVSLMNPMSEEQEILVPTLVPGLVQAHLESRSHRFGTSTEPIGLFSVRPTFCRSTGERAEKGDPKFMTGVDEIWRVGFLIAGNTQPEMLATEAREIDFFGLKAIAFSLLEAMGFVTKRVVVQPAQSMSAHLLSTPGVLHPGMSAAVYQHAGLVGRSALGFMGRLSPVLEQRLKTRMPVYVAEFFLDPLKARWIEAGLKKFKEPPTFPTMERDFALLVKDSVVAGEVLKAVEQEGKPLVQATRVFDVYRGQQIPEGMTSLAVRVIFSAEGRSLQEPEIEATCERIVNRWKRDFGAELRT